MKGPSVTVYGGRSRRSTIRLVPIIPTGLNSVPIYLHIALLVFWTCWDEARSQTRPKLLLSPRQETEVRGLGQVQSRNLSNKPVL